MATEQQRTTAQEYWDYDKPPGIFDLIQNNLLSNGIRIILHILFRIYLRLYHRIRFQNNKPYHDLSGTLIVANHSSHLDTPAIFAAFPLLKINRIRSLAAKDYFFKNAFQRNIGFFIANTIPLDRSKYDSESFVFCHRKISAGANLILFPEGTRTLDGVVHDFKPGVGMLTVKFGVAVLPVYINGTYQSYPKGRIFPRPKRITVIFGEQINYPGVANDKSGWQAIANDLQQKIVALAKSDFKRSNHV